MKYFRYSIANDEIRTLLGEVETIPPHYIELKNSLGSEKKFTIEFRMEYLLML